MAFSPIVDRELLVAARRKSTFHIRMWTAVAGAVATSLFLIFFGLTGVLFGGAMNPGMVLFGLLTWYMFGLCLLAGVVLAADSVSEEKRDGTLGLLFLTDLRGYDVALGKFIGTALPSFYALVACLPIVAFPMLMGGVTQGEFWRIALALVNALFFSLALGLLVSVFSREAARAMAAALALIAGIMIVFEALDAIFPTYRGLSGWWYLISASPLHSFNNGLASGYASPAGPGKYWVSLIATHLLGWAFLFAAGLLLPRAWRDDPSAGPVSRVDKLESALRAFLQRGRRGTRRLLDINPVFWVASNWPNLRPAAWTVALVYACGVLAMTLWTPASGIQIQFAAQTYLMRAFGFLLKLIAAAQACRFFADARKSGALELILCTPVREWEIIRGQWLAFWRVLRWPSIVFIVFSLLPALRSLLESLGVLPGNTITTGFGGMGIILAVSIGYQVLKYVMDMFSVGWFGMCLALIVRKPNQALMFTILFVLVLPSFAFCVPDVLIDIFFIYWGGMKVQTSIHALVESQVKPPAPGTQAPDAGLAVQ